MDSRSAIAKCSENNYSWFTETDMQIRARSAKCLVVFA